MLEKNLQPTAESIILNNSLRRFGLFQILRAQSKFLR
jgi:hypothetical protein